MVNVLHEILRWSQNRPAWQRDALRRLVQSGNLYTDDISALSEICKAAHGLVEPREASPIRRDHVPDERGTASPVSLVSIFHHRGVNALAEGQTLSFGPSLNVVYGDNAAGKTGYIRILKSACRARGQEEILGNVVAGTTPLTPVVAVKYKVGTDQDPREWAGQGKDEYISRVSVFDTRCAAVYLSEKTNVAFRPFGLDLFDKLVRACKAVRQQLERERQALVSNAVATLQAQIPEGTAVEKLLANVNSLTKPEAVEELSRISAVEEGRLTQLQQSLLDLAANDPKELIRHLTLRAGRVETLRRHIRDVDAALSVQAVDAVFNARTQYWRKRAEATNLRETTFPEGILAGTGSDLWASLWESARRFSQEFAYSEQPFPVVENGAQCVLCQQDLDDGTRCRLQHFEAYVTSTIEKQLRRLRDTYERLCKTFTDLKVTSEWIEETLEEIRIEHEADADAIVVALATAEGRRRAVAIVLSEDRDLPSDCPALMDIASKADVLNGQILERVKTLRSNAPDETRKRLIAEERELRARKVLGQQKQIVLDEIDRKRKIAAYGLCIDDTKTHMITKESTVVTREAVTQKIKQSFQKELSSLDFQHVEVELKEVGGSEGVLYHKLVLRRAPGVELPKVVSEGEQRCLSIAAFFAELSTAEDSSGIVFDDPVSSLDYKWREGVARRLVEEANKRQVIVFTHDVVFLLLLKQLAGEKGVTQVDQHVRQLSNGAGVCSEELPWVALKVSKRIGHLRRLLQDAEKLHRDGHQAAYEREASLIYGYLREAWERGLEEVLLGGVVERYRPGVQTQQVAVIADITVADCKAVETAMTKCSQWLPGHDRAPAARADIPEPETIKADIEALSDWVGRIRRRRT